MIKSRSQNLITVNLYQYEFSALVSLTFNTGVKFLSIGGAKKGDTKIKLKINNKDYEGGADEMADVTNGGTVGLIKRRKAEINMFKTNTYDSTH
ncbi:glycoside hydrolase family protein [Kaistella gelatinilytica]|uniref:glycoside hydrolase family protein n=1 Tax=Kaistella gelatinilytica TaxID=2787636 RepID=UPI003742120F